MRSMVCKAGRNHDPGHPTCRSCERQNAMVCRGVISARANKHGNVKTEIDGIVFDSKREASHYLRLKMLERSGVITDVKTQVSFVLAPAVVLDGRRKPELRYRADFVYRENGKQVIVDAKSPHLRKNPVYRNKKHLMATVLGLLS